MRLQDRVAVVTGGGSGIGEWICRRFDEEGAHVVVLDIRGDAAALTAGLMKNEAASYEVDVTDSAQVNRAIEDVVERLGRVDVLVNNAGIVGGDESIRNADRLTQRLREVKTTGQVSTPLEATVHITDDQFRLMMETHVFGAFYCIRAVLPIMVAQRSGSIVNIGSRCGQEGCVVTPHYSTAKGALHALTRVVALDVAESGVRVNGIAPGFVETPLNDFLSQEALDAAVAATPIGRQGRPSEIADAAVFLASDESSFIVGQMIAPNGGMNTSPV
jgi:NAD(P)-dependent dehydrogenase (short-subunit alcohol dehydrogenase family)